MADRLPPSQPELFPSAGPAKKAKRAPPRAGEETRARGGFRLAAQVAVATHGDLLSYGVPQALEDQVAAGHRVTLPLRGHLVTGLVWRVLPAEEVGFDPTRLRPLVAVAPQPPVPLDVLKALDFVAQYYHCTLGQVVRMALPAPMRHTGVEGDDAPELLQWMVGSAEVHPWPDGLTKQEVRILQRVEAAGELTVTELRRKSLGDSPVRVAQAAPQSEGLLDQVARGLQSRATPGTAPGLGTGTAPGLGTGTGTGAGPGTGTGTGAGPGTGTGPGTDPDPDLDPDPDPATPTAPWQRLPTAPSDAPWPMTALPSAAAPSPSPTSSPRAIAAPQALLQSLADRGLLRLWQERKLRDPLGMRTPIPRDTPPALHPEQLEAVARIAADLHARRYAGHLVRGVTGSGKTEVYLHVIEQALALGRGAIVLVPEIALTPQLVHRFRARFGDEVAALHSGMSDGERYDQNSLVAEGKRRIVVGPRSALWAPVRDLGVLVVDECHDPSFKQQNGVRYHARDVALVRAREAQAVCVLGSATPGCEEMHLATAGRLHLTELAHRARGGALPACRTIDLKDAEKLVDPDSQAKSLITHELFEAIRETVARGEQAILLHNRRGYAASMICRSCGTALECEDCAITLTYHKNQGRLRCHYCDDSVSVDSSCPNCKAFHWISVGAGTERIEATLQHYHPQLRVARFDRDTAVGQRMLDTLERFRRRELDVLVGTQMLAKGHDFPAVTLVGVVLAESGLRVPDLRAAERTFQLLTQVAGRAGRADRPGRVLVQTYQPEHPAIRAALHHDHPGFLAHELKLRQQAAYPPYTHLALLEIQHEDQARAQGAMEVVAQHLRDWGAEVQGPVKAGLERLRGLYRVHARIVATERRPLHRWLDRLRREIEPGLGVDLTVDVDPYSFM